MPRPLGRQRLLRCGEAVNPFTFHAYAGGCLPPFVGITSSVGMGSVAAPVLEKLRGFQVEPGADLGRSSLRPGRCLPRRTLSNWGGGLCAGAFTWVQGRLAAGVGTSPGLA
jgi:hypothetical protein